jgi:cyanophycinase-like exopeptidase
LHYAKLIEAIRKRVLAGMPYVGSSAGSNIAGPTILTTNGIEENTWLSIDGGIVTVGGRARVKVYKRRTAPE